MHFRQARTAHTPETLVSALRGEPGLVLLRSGRTDMPQGRYSFVAVRPFLIFRAFGSRCEIRNSGKLRPQVWYGNPWDLLDAWSNRYELADEVDLPFPTGGCFGFWGYDLRHFVEPKLRGRAVADLELPDCHVGFYSSLVAFDHQNGETWVISTGLQADGSQLERRAREELEFWEGRLREDPPLAHAGNRLGRFDEEPAPRSTLSREEFVKRVRKAQDYIRRGHIYQVNLAQRLSVKGQQEGWDLYTALSEASPAPFSAYLDCGEFELVSSSPELFLRMSGRGVQTRPIKGTRGRSGDPDTDARLMCELQTSGKEMAELVMITDLLRNDLARVCEFGSVQVPELARLERYAQVQHLVSTVEGRLRPGVTHFGAFASCFPGGSITGAPKFRAMEIIDELEPVARGPYTGALGYLGFNRESQLSIVIRTAIREPNGVHYYTGAGIVADSVPEAEYEETLLKAKGFLAALSRVHARPAGRAKGP